MTTIPIISNITIVNNQLNFQTDKYQVEPWTDPQMFKIEIPVIGNFSKEFNDPSWTEKYQSWDNPVHVIIGLEIKQDGLYMKTQMIVKPIKV